MVELVHAMVSLGVDEASPDRNKEGWEDEHDGGDVDGDHGPPPHDPVDEGGDEGGARLVPAEVRVVDDVLESVEEDDGVVLGLDFVAEAGVLFHVVVELMQRALFQEPGLVLAGLFAGSVRFVEDVYSTDNEEGCV
tara:strand:+ start:14806 stop:15213 length:408 start_codon:yes stop_codon:yes gene_type:complete